MNQLSLSRDVRVDGVNVYNGKRNFVVFHPGEENSGLVFLTNGYRVPADLRFAENRKKGIGLSNGEGNVCLVEHLLSAVYALGIDNLNIELSDSVCPTVDNCAYEYFEALRHYRASQLSSKKSWKYVGTGESCIRSSEKGKRDCIKVNSTDGFVIDYLSYYPHKVIGKQRERFEVDEENYARNIVSARSTGFLKNEFFKRLFLRLGRIGFHGINEKNYLLVTSLDSSKYANSKEFGVRYGGMEFVRHKILDVMGTLALTGGAYVDTEFKHEMTGHRFDLFALKELFASGCFERQ